MEARRVSCCVKAVECFKSERRASRVVGLRSNGGMGCGWKSGAKKALTSDHAREIDAASAAFDGEMSGLGRLSIRFDLWFDIPFLCLLLVRLMSKSLIERAG